MQTLAIVLLLLLQLPAFNRLLSPLRRVEFTGSGVWWVTWYAGGRGATRIARWPWNLNRKNR